MRPLRKFEEFVERGIVRKRTPDIQRAKSLREEAEKRKKFLVMINNYNCCTNL